MGKNKYPQTTGVGMVDGEKKRKDCTKTGKLAKRRELRRLEAIARQVENVRDLEALLSKASDKKAADLAIRQAQLTLQKIRGGKPHSELDKAFKAETKE